MRRARVFPLFRRFRGGRKKTVSMFRSSGRGLQRRFRDSCFLDLRASAKSARRILNRELIFFFSSPTLGGETETHTNASRKNKKGRGESSSSASWCEQARTIFRETSNYRAREWTLFATRERRVPDRETRRTRVRVARRRKHPREGAHFGRVRSNAARAESQPTFQKMLVFSPFAPSRVSRQPPSGDAPGRRARRRLRDAERRARL